MGNTAVYIQDDVLTDYEQDTFGHKHIADAVVDSINNTKPPYIIGIFGGWGTGKSSLLGKIESSLPKNQFRTATIDAWRYTTSDNLQRAFLVHVSKQLAPKLLDDLRKKLYTSEQETVPGKPSEFDILKKQTWRQALNFLLIFVGLSFLFLVFLFIILGINFWIVNGSLENFWSEFDWSSFIDKFLDLAFIPFLLSIINYVRLNITHRPVTVIQERVDADELFSEYFDKVVDNATECVLGKKRLVIFVDNLDRLTDDKMVDALESLKTYISNRDCIFVVACDNDVIRSVINASEKIPKISKQGQFEENAGEHYLDKFFQQTFRLPEYMNINLHDFAETNFRSTKLSEKLINVDVDIRNLISIILPSDVTSPRKVKRLLNEFIALYEIVSRRENESNGQLRPGLLTSNPEFLGKISTLRAEYPKFYRALIKNTTLLTNITNSFLNQEEEIDIDTLMNETQIPNQDSLISYLRKTQTIMVDDLEPYIWLSQDTLALGLSREHNIILQTSLSNGDIDQVRNLINSADDITYKILLTRVASRIVEERLVGIEQQNGVKVLAEMLPEFDDSIKPEIALVEAKLIPSWPIDTFSSHELFNVLRWGERGINIQKNNLIHQVLERLKSTQLRKQTFDAILQNADVIEDSNATAEIQGWLKDIFDKVRQSENEYHEFFEYLIAQAKDYREDDLVIDNYFSGVVVSYAIGRVVGDYPGIEPTTLDEDGFGKDCNTVLDSIVNRVINGSRSSALWEGLLQLSAQSYYEYEVRYYQRILRELIIVIPIGMIESFVISIFTGIKNIVENIDENEIQISLLTDSYELVHQLRKHKGDSLNIQELDSLTPEFSQMLTNYPGIRESLLSFSVDFTNNFGESDGTIFISGIILSFESSSQDLGLGMSLLKSLKSIDEYLSQEQRQGILNRVNELVISNDENLINNAISYITVIGDLQKNQEIISGYSGPWISIIGDDPPSLLQKKLHLASELVSLNYAPADDVANQVIPLFPFGGDRSKLQLVVENLSRVKDKISEPVGGHLFEIIINNISVFEPDPRIALDFISDWTNNVQNDLRSQFHSVLDQHFISSPKEYIPILNRSWIGLNLNQVKRSLIRFYEVDIDSEYPSIRDKSVTQALKEINDSDRASVIRDVWIDLAPKGNHAESFLNLAKKFISLSSLLELRDLAIKSVREGSASAESEINLRLLTVTTRDDMREIMPAVDLFVNLFGRGQAEVQLALKYVVPSLKPLNLRNDHKHKLAEAMGQAALRTDEQAINSDIHIKADQLGLKWFSYRKHWKGT